MTKTLVHSSVVFRHGSRGPTPTCLGRLKDTAAPAQWLPHEIGKLTPRGQRQAVAMGAWIGDVYLAQQQPEFASKIGPVLWYTSPSQRVIDSGFALVGALLDCDVVANPKSLTAADLRTRTPKYDELKVFRAYANSKEYVSAVNEFRTNSTTWGQHASTHGERLTQLMNPVFVAKLLEQDMSEQVTRTNEAWLDLSTYIHEVVECERFWDDVGREQRDTNQEDSDKDSVVVGEQRNVRNAMLSQLDTDALEAIESYAVWCWQGRFMSIDNGKWAKTLGGALLELMQDAAKAATKEKPTLRLWAAHDYTILSVLAALLEDTYPGDGESALGFGSFLVMEVWEDDEVLAADGSAQRSVCVWLNGKPFTKRQGDDKGPDAGSEYAESTVSDDGASDDADVVGVDSEGEREVGVWEVTEDLQDTRIAILDMVNFPPPSVLLE